MNDLEKLAKALDNTQKNNIIGLTSDIIRMAVDVLSEALDADIECKITELPKEKTTEEPKPKRTLGDFNSQVIYNATNELIEFAEAMGSKQELDDFNKILKLAPGKFVISIEER